MPYKKGDPECEKCEVKETCEKIGCKNCHEFPCHANYCPSACGVLL